MTYRLLISVCAVSFGITAFGVTAANAGDASAEQLKALLGQRVIEPDLPMEEVQEFTESRVPPMPEPRSLDDWQKYAKQTRQNVLDRVVFRGEAAKWRTAKTRIEWLETLPGGDGYQIKTLRYEALPGLWIPALLYEPDQLVGKVPVVMNVNGHDRTGKAAKYKQIRCINQAKRGMLALNVEWLGMGQLNTPGFNHYRMNQLDLCGTSGLAPFYLAMSRGLDVLLSLENADPERVAVAGLSGGGWQTIFISSLDTRVTLSNPVAGYSSFLTRARHLSDLGDSEQTPSDLASVADYMHLTALRAPRPTLLTFNAQDNCCFRADHALPPLVEASRPIFKLYGKADSLRTHVNHDPGDHNFERDNRQQFYRMLGDHFYPGGDFNPDEIACDDELLSKDELTVPLPGDNADFHSLANALSRELPRHGQVPDNAVSARKWQADRRERLRSLVRFHPYKVQATAGNSKTVTDRTMTTWRLRIGGTWTVPAVEVAPADAKTTVVLLADEGRTSAAAQAARHLQAGHRILAIDPFYLGESKIAKRDWLFGLLVAAVGERPLGIQASQIAAVARWSKTQFGGPVQVSAVGPRTSLTSLVAASLEPEHFSRVELHGSFGSLRQVIEQDLTVREAPELFCFGLLAEFDVRPLAALAAPCPVRFTDADEK